MTSYRPKIKQNENGTVSDLALDAETVQGYKPCINVVTLEDNGSTTAGKWLAKSSRISSLVDGQLFLYKITVAGASTTTLNITGSGGTALGEKTVYRTGTTKLTTQYDIGHYILLVYNSLNTAFRVINDYDANSYAYLRQYQHGENAAGTTNLYPILTRYNLTNKNGAYDTAYSRFHTETYINMTNGYLYAPKVYSGGSEVALKTDIPSAVTESTVAGWGFTKNVGTVTKVNNTSPDSNGNVSITIPTVDYPVTDVKVNNTSVVSSKVASISAVTKLGTRTGDITIATLKSDLGLGSAAYTDSTAYATSSHTHSSLKSGNYTASLPTLTANATLALTSDIPTAVTEATVSGWGFTKNTGTVTSVSAGTGLSISGTASTTPTVNVASGYKLLTTTEYNTLNAKVSNVQSDWNATTGLARILNKPDILPITNYTGDSPVELYNLSKGRYINATSNDIYLFNYAGGSTLPLVKWHPGEILTVLDNLHNWVLETIYANEYYIFSGKANSRFDQSEYRGFSAADVPAAGSSGLGSVGKPLYIDVITNEQGMKQNVFKECNQFAGATKLILNGTDLSSLATFLYAPTTSGTSGQFLKSAGANASPTWETVTIPTKSSWNYDDMYVKYTAAQTLTETQQAQARANIGASRNPHEHPTYLETTADTPSVTMVPDASYKLTTGGGSNVIFKTPSDAYKLMESLRKGSEETTAVGYYKIATINHNNWNFCNFTMLITNTYSGTVYDTIFECRCSDNNNTLVNFGLNIIAGTDISSKLTYLYTKDTNNYITKIEVFIHATRFEHPICYILNTRPGQQLVIPTQQEFNKVTPDQPDGTTMTGTAKYIYDSMYLKKGGDTIGTGGLTLGSGNGNGILFPSSAASSGDSSIGIYDSSNNNQYCTLNGFISGTFTVGHGNFPLNLRGSATRPQYKGADLALKSDIPTRVTGSLSYPTNTGGLATLFNLINNHRNIRLWTYKYTSGSKSTEIRNLLYFTTHNELSGSLYTVKLSYINSAGTLTEMTSGTIYYEYFT